MVRCALRMILFGALTAYWAGCGDQHGQQEPETRASPQKPQGQAEVAEKAKSAADPGEVEITVAARAEAEQIFSTRCMVCHGAQGKGDGPGSAALDPKPRDYTDPKWQASVTDEHIHKIIVYGGAAVGKAPTMPGNPDLANQPAVVAALREHIRGLSDEQPESASAGR